MMILCLALAGVSLSFCGAMHYEASAEDLRRARSTRPLAPFVSTAGRHAVPTVLNAGVSGKYPELRTRQCATATLAEVQTIQSALTALASPELQLVYSSGADRRGVDFSMQSVHIDQISFSHPAMPVMRAGFCAQAMMQFAHHLSEEAKEEFIQRWWLPLLDDTDHSAVIPKDNVTENIVALYQRQTSCFDCHTHAATTHGGPHLWPTNFNGTLYMYSDASYVQRKKVDYRWSSASPQYINYGDDTAPDKRARDCVVLFDEDDSVWEWHTASRTCTKIFEGVPMNAPGWTQFMNVSHGEKKIYNPWTNYTATCKNWCAPNHGPCICEAAQDGVPNAPIWHSHIDDTGLGGGFSIYEDIVLTPELHNARIPKPEYCPHSSVKPLFDRSMCQDLDACLQATCYNCLEHPEAVDCPNHVKSKLLV